MNNQTPPQCDSCGTEMKLVPAGVSQRTGKSYSAFWSCPHNRECGGKTILATPKKGTMAKPLKEYDQGEAILKGLREIYAKIDNLEKSFKTFAEIFTNKQAEEDEQ